MNRNDAHADPFLQTFHQTCSWNRIKKTKFESTISHHKENWKTFAFSAEGWVLLREPFRKTDNPRESTLLLFPFIFFFFHFLGKVGLVNKKKIFVAFCVRPHKMVFRILFFLSSWDPKSLQLFKRSKLATGLFGCQRRDANIMFVGKMAKAREALCSKWRLSAAIT